MPSHSPKALRAAIPLALLSLLPAAAPAQRPAPPEEDSAPLELAREVELVETPPGQGEADPAIAALLVPYQISVARASIPLLSSYLERLASLEAKLVSRADYHGAIAVAKEQELVRGQLVYLQERLGDEGSNSSQRPAPLVLSPADAARSGTLANGSENALASWDPAAHATWILPGIEPGAYEVRLALAIAPDATTTSFLLREKFFTLTAPLDPADAKPIAASSSAATHVASLGTLKIRSGDGPLRIELAPDASPPKGLSILQIQLTPTFAH
jgi:hypothetical protein